jgi:hypothetical protein
MAVEKTIKLQADVKDAVKGIEKLTDQVDDLGKTAKATEGATRKLERGFKGVGLAFKAMGIALILKIFDKLSAALMRNQQVADTVNTIFNSIGVVFKMVTDTIVNIVSVVGKSSANFDALGKVMVNLLNIALTPIKLAFYSIKLGIQTAHLIWKKSWLGGGGKDIQKIRELEAGIQETKKAIVDTAVAAWESGKEVVKNFGEAVNEVKNIGEVVVDEFQKTFDGVTTKSIIEQGKAITEAKKNYELLGLQQQRLIEQYDREAELLRQTRDDETLSFKERIAANEELGEVLKRQNEAETAAIDAQIEALQNRIALEGESVELTNEIFALETEKLAVAAKVTGFESEQKMNKIALEKEEAAAIQATKDAKDKQLEDDKKRAAEEKRIAKQSAIDKIEIERKLAETRRGIIAGSLGNIAQLMGEESKGAKALAVAQALINTYSAAAAALAPPPVGAGPIFGPIAAVGAIAAGMANVKSILSTKVAGESGGGGGGGPAPATPSEPAGMGPMSPNMENIQGVELGGGDEGGQVQAFVVENDISNAQALQEELDLQSTL